MATRKGARVAADRRPSLDEVKQQVGRNMFVIYEGVEKGPMNIPALRPRFVGDMPEELSIDPWQPKMLSEEWLDDVRFRDLYASTPGLRVWKTDEYPRPVDLTLPEELERSVSEPRRQNAYLIATNPYTPEMKEFLNIKNIDVSEIAAEQWNNTELYPFLECVLFYEQKLAKRKEVIRDIEKRMGEIDSEAEKKNRRQRWQRYGV